MTQLASNAVRPNRSGEFREYPVLTAVAIYEGSAVGLQLSSGYARQLVATTDLDRFLGFAQEEADNTGGASGAKRVTVRTRGEILLAVTGVDGVDDLGKDVYASDGNTFTVTSADDTVHIGKIVQHVAGTSCWVAFDTDAASKLHKAHLADVTVTGADSDGTARTAINAIKDALVDAGIYRAAT